MKFSQVMAQKMRYVVGLEKLASASAQVAVMQTELTDLQPLLVVAAEEVAEIMIKVEKESVEVAKVEKASINHSQSTSHPFTMYVYTFLCLTLFTRVRRTPG